MTNCTTTHSTNCKTRQRKRTEMTKTTTRTLLALTVAALVAVSSTSAFSILPTAPTTRIANVPQSQQKGGLSPTVACTAPKRSRATTLLFTSPLDETTLDENDDQASLNEECALASSSSSLRTRLHSWKCWIQFWRTNLLSNLTKRRHARVAKAVAASLVSAGSIATVMGGVPAPVYARTLQENLEEGTVVYSLRPGVSKEQAEQLGSGIMPDEVRDQIDAKTAIGSTTGLSKEESAAKARQKDTLYGDYDDYDDEDYAADEEEFGDSSYGNSVAPSKQRQKSFSSDASSGDASSAISKGTKTTFSGISSDTSKTKPFSLYAKISLACFLPTFGVFGVRDFVRNRQEEKNVQKAIEIVDAQRAEYFGIDKDGKNITDTEDSDSDIEDELKELKDGEEDEDDEDDDEDDDDEDDAPPRRRRSLPKPPKGPQGDGSGGFDGFDDDDDDDGPSDEDIQRLGDIFNKS